MVTEGKEAFGLAEILYCCLCPDKTLLISRLDKHSDTIDTRTQADVLQRGVVVFVPSGPFFQHNDSK